MPTIHARFRVEYNQADNEWLVACYDFTEARGWKKNEDRTYYASDRADALATATAMIAEEERNHATS